MGTSCCFHIRDPEEDVSPCQNCICLNCIIHTLLRKYTGIKSNEQLDALASTAQVAAPLSSDAATSNIESNNVVTSAPIILHFEVEATCSSEHQDGQIKGKEDDQVDQMEHDSKGNKSDGLQCDSESQLKFSSEKPEAEVASACELSEDEEDVCPTCLEEYIPENPRIVLQCSHSYHLSCIYEWMERSENCPICGKMMIFEEAA